MEEEKEEKKEKEEEKEQEGKGGGRRGEKGEGREEGGKIGYLDTNFPLCCAKMNLTGVKRTHRERATAAISILLTGLVVDE